MSLGYVRRHDRPSHHPAWCDCDGCWRPADSSDFEWTHDLAKSRDEALRQNIAYENELLADANWSNHGGSI